jgi:hypothetical protein
MADLLRIDLTADRGLAYLETITRVGVAKYASGDTVTVSQVRILIDNSTMNTLPYPEERGDDLDLAYDLLVTLSGAAESKDYYGTFKVRGTVTQ